MNSYNKFILQLSENKYIGRTIHSFGGLPVLGYNLTESIWSPPTEQYDIEQKFKKPFVTETSFKDALLFDGKAQVDLDIVKVWWPEAKWVEVTVTEFKS